MVTPPAFVRAILLVFAAALVVASTPQQARPQGSSVPLVALPVAWPEDITRYTIDARLDVATHRVHGRARIEWRNTSTQSVPDLQFHFYQNAYRDESSTYMRENLRGNPGFAARLRGRWGSLDVQSMRLATGEDLLPTLEYVHPDDDNEADRTAARVVLPRPAAPGETVTLEVEFVNQLSPTIERSGYDRDFYFVAQWYPKLGVYEDAGVRGRKEPGWNCHQFHATSEFYSDFGTYDVKLTLPNAFAEKFGSTGVIRDRIANDDGTTTLSVLQEHVHDFAWTTDPDYLVVERLFAWREHVTDAELHRAAEVAGIAPEQAALRDVNVRLLIQPEHARQAERHIRATFVAIEGMGLRFGAYPYDQITIVDPSYGGGAVGGMEYPTLVTIGTSYFTPATDYNLEGTIVHEFAHQYWYGVVATNEFEESWMDEGISDYCEGSILEDAYGPRWMFDNIGGLPVLGTRLLTVHLPRVPFAGVEVPVGPFLKRIPYSGWQHERRRYLREPSADPMLQPSWRFRDFTSYVVNSYSKPAAMLHALERHLGYERFTRGLRAFHLRWRFRHPSTSDFVETMNEVTGEDLNQFFAQFVYGSGQLDYGIAQFVSRSTGGSMYDTRVTVERTGDVVLPVTLLVRFADGSEKTDHWDGVGRWHEFSFTGASRAVSTELDPNGVFSSLDVNLTNNGRLMEPDTTAADAMSVEALFWFQTLLHELSLLS